MRRLPEIDRRFDTEDRYQFHPDLNLTEVEALADWCGGSTLVTRDSNNRVTRVVILLDGVVVRRGEWISRDGGDFRIETAA